MHGPGHYNTCMHACTQDCGVCHEPHALITCARASKRQNTLLVSPTRYNMKMEEQLKIYDPFGKGGGGAPVRDADGNLVSKYMQILLHCSIFWWIKL